MPPELQIFLNAQEVITHECVFRPSAREVVVGALGSLARRLGPKYADNFSAAVPKDPQDALLDYAFTLRSVMDTPDARAEGWTMKKLVESSIDAYCRTLDPYSEYTDEVTAERLEVARRPDYVGIGVTVRRTERGLFCSPFRGGAASRAGLQDGDELIEVNGANARGMTQLEVVESLGGSPGTAVRLRVRHANGTSEKLEAMREQISSSPLAVEVTPRGSRISFVRIDRRAYEDLQQTLLSLGPKSDLILDFRGCPGGELDYAVRIAEIFLPQKTVIAKMEGNAETRIEVSRNATPYQPGNLLLWQDLGTASGAELIIAALLGYAPLKAESRGERTYGKGVTDKVFHVRRGGFLQITSSHLFGPHGEFWDREGLSPSSDKKLDAP